VGSTDVSGARADPLATDVVLCERVLIITGDPVIKGGLASSVSSAGLRGALVAVITLGVVQSHGAPDVWIAVALLASDPLRTGEHLTALTGSTGAGLPDGAGVLVVTGRRARLMIAALYGIAEVHGAWISVVAVQADTSEAAAVRALVEGGAHISVITGGVIGGVDAAHVGLA